MLMKSFSFEKALMQQHFNENYVESDKFPRAEFEGRISDFGKADFSTSKSQKLTAKGKMTIHGVTREIIIEGTMAYSGGKYKLDAVFIIKPADYDIKIPASVKDNIAEEIQVTLAATLEVMK
jgi:polyisoprenoid-binding protein YceI